jgi:small subunit ribosomal protein S8
MTMTDPVADLLSRIRTAYLAKHDRLDVPASKLKLEICGILKEQGYLESVQLLDSDPVKKQVRIYLRYTPEGEPLIRKIKRVSSPGRRVYKGAEEIRPVLNGLGVRLHRGS